MSFWATVLAMTMATTGPKIIYWLAIKSPWYRKWNTIRGYGATRWSMFAPKWLKRITRKTR